MKHYLRLWNKRVEEFSDWVANLSSKPSFILAHIVWWAVWMIFKVEVFPYGLLTLIVSLEAIVLSSLILSSSNREGEQEKNISRKTLSKTKETNWMTEEILEVVRDMQEEIRRFNEEEEI